MTLDLKNGICIHLLSRRNVILFFKYKMVKINNKKSFFLIFSTITPSINLSHEDSLLKIISFNMLYRFNDYFFLMNSLQL